MMAAPPQASAWPAPPAWYAADPWGRGQGRGPSDRTPSSFGSSSGAGAGFGVGMGGGMGMNRGSAWSMMDRGSNTRSSMDRAPWDPRNARNPDLDDERSGRTGGVMGRGSAWFLDHDDRREEDRPFRRAAASPTRWSNDLWERLVKEDPWKRRRVDEQEVVKLDEKPAKAAEEKCGEASLSGSPAKNCAAQTNGGGGEGVESAAAEVAGEGGASQSKGEAAEGTTAKEDLRRRQSRSESVEADADAKAKEDSASESSR